MLGLLVTLKTIAVDLGAEFRYRRALRISDCSILRSWIQSVGPLAPLAHGGRIPRCGLREAALDLVAVGRHWIRCILPGRGIKAKI